MHIYTSSLAPLSPFCTSNQVYKHSGRLFQSRFHQSLLYVYRSPFMCLFLCGLYKIRRLSDIKGQKSPCSWYISRYMFKVHRFHTVTEYDVDTWKRALWHTHTQIENEGGLCNTNENETAIIIKETKAQSVVSLSISAAGREMHGKLNATLGAAPRKVVYFGDIEARPELWDPCLCSTSVYMMFTLQQKPDGASDFTCEYTLARKGEGPYQLTSGNTYGNVDCSPMHYI